MTGLAAKTIVLLLIMAFISGCGQAPAQKRIMKAEIDVRVIDPVLKELIDVTSRINIVVSGEFSPGTYLIEKTSLTFAPNTKFLLKLSLPINDLSVIHNRNASGTLWTSQPFSVNAIAVPQTITLAGGTVSGDVDLVRSMGVFFLQLLQAAPIVGDFRQMIL